MAHPLVRGLVHKRGIVLCSFADLADADAYLLPYGVQRSHARIPDHLISPRLNVPQLRHTASLFFGRCTGDEALIHTSSLRDAACRAGTHQLPGRLRGYGFYLRGATRLSRTHDDTKTRPCQPLHIERPRSNTARCQRHIKRGQPMCPYYAAPMSSSA